MKRIYAILTAVSVCTALSSMGAVETLSIGEGGDFVWDYTDMPNTPNVQTFSTADGKITFELTMTAISNTDGKIDYFRSNDKPRLGVLSSDTNYSDRVESIEYGDASDDEGILLQLSVTDLESSITNLWLSGIGLRHLIDGEQVEFIDNNGSNMWFMGVNATNTSGTAIKVDNKHPQFNYVTAGNALTDLTPLGTNNVGGTGDGTWQLTFMARDGNLDFGTSNSITQITIFSVSFERAITLAPVAFSQSVSTLFETPLPITLTGSDPGLTFAILDNPVSGVLSGAAPDVTYEPNADTWGDDSFTFTVYDGAQYGTGTVSITVHPPFVQLPLDIDGDIWEDAMIGNQTYTSSAYKDGVTFNLTMEAINLDSNLVQVGSALLNKSGGNVVVSGAGPDDLGLDFLGTTNEAVKLTLSLTPGTGITVTNLWLDMLRFAAWGKDDDGVLFISESNTYSFAGSGNARFNYTDADTILGGNAVQELVGITPLTVDNVGGIGDNTWELIIVSAISGTRSNSSFSVQELEFFFEKTGTLVTEYQHWANQYPGLGGPGDDDDGDSLDNLGEYGLGGNPTNPADRGYTEVRSGSGSLEYIYAKRSSVSSGISYSLEGMTNLYFPFNSSVPGLTVVGVGAIDSEFNAVTNQVPVDSDTKFLKLIIEEL